MPTLVWDIDDVLNNLMEAWFTTVWLPAHPDRSLRYQDILDNPPYHSLGVTKAEYFQSLDAFRESVQAHKMAPNPVIVAWLGEHGRSYRHVALTARPLASSPAAAEWLFRHFGQYFRCFGVVPSRAGASTPIYDRDKSDFLRWLGEADCLIDDSAENVAAARKLGIPAVLYPQPWNGATASVDEALRTITQLVNSETVTLS